MMRGRRWIAAGWTVLAAAAATAAPSADDLAVVFGARPAAHGLVLSPLGAKALYLAPFDDNGTAVLAVDIASGKVKVVLGNKNNSVLPVSCRWKSEQRLVCTLYGITLTATGPQSFTRVVAVDADGSKMKVLGQHDSFEALRNNMYSGAVIDWLPDDPTHVLMQIDVPGELVTGTRLHAVRPGVSAQRVDIYTAAMTMVTQANTQIDELGTDNHGNVRFRVTNTGSLDGYTRDKLHYSVRAKDSGDWKTIGTASRAAVAGLKVKGFDETDEWLYVLKPLDGRQALYKLAADGSGRSELVFSHPIVDVDGVYRIGKYRRPVGVDYTVDAEQRDYFDPALLKLTRSLSEALPNNPEVNILGESWDQTKRLVAAGGSATPGIFYLYDATSHELNELLAVRPQLKPLTLASVKPVRYPAADGTMIPAYLTLPPGVPTKALKTIIMPHGGPSSRDTGGFDWLAQYYVQLGYAVLQPNFRGSSGYGEAWYRNNGFKSWATAIGDVNDGARWLVKQGIADKDRLAIVGWSYGGYAALQANVLDPGLYKAVIAVAPVTDLAELRNRADRFIDFLEVYAFIGEGPHVIAGSPARHAAVFRAPVLMFSGDRDLNVDVSQARTMDSALASAGKAHELKIYPGLDHLLDDSAARTDMLRRSAAFLAANVK